MDDRKTMEAPMPDGVDERGVARKYGVRELVYPDSEQVKVLVSFLSKAVETGTCGPVPKTAVLVMHDFLQATVNRQHITKGPRMSHEEYDILQAPYYLAARIVARIDREKRAEAKNKGKLYETTYLTLTHCIEVLHNLLDPGCYWQRKAIPQGALEVMEVLWDFARIYPEQRRKHRA